MIALSHFSISSRKDTQRSHSVLVFLRSGIISRHAPAPSTLNPIANAHGTRVTVKDLFGNIPVRVKQRSLYFNQGAERSEWNSLMRKIAAFLLARDKSVKVCLWDDSKNQETIIQYPKLGQTESFEASEESSRFDIRPSLTLLTRIGMITPQSWPSWVPVSAWTSIVKLQGAISLDAAPTKDCQFVSINKQPVFHSGDQDNFYDEINRIFASSKFGMIDEEADIEDAERDRRLTDGRFKKDGYTRSRLVGGRIGIDRWPMFWLKIDAIDIDGRRPIGVEIGEAKEAYSQKVVRVVVIAITQWLQRHHMKPRSRMKTYMKPASQRDRPESAQIQSRHYRHSSRRLENGITSLGTVPNLVKGSDGTFNENALVSAPRTHSSPTALCIPMSDCSRIKSGKPEFFEHAFAARRPNATFALKKTTLDEYSPSQRKASFNHSKERLKDAERFSEASCPHNAKQATGMTGGTNGNKQLNSPSCVRSLAESEITSAQSVRNDEYVLWQQDPGSKDCLLNVRNGEVRPRSEVEHVNVINKRLFHRCQNSRESNSAGKSGKELGNVEQSGWIDRFLVDWNNPAFESQEEGIDSISCEKLQSAGFCDSAPRRVGEVRCRMEGITLPQITKLHNSCLAHGALKEAKVISQLDRKFLLLKIPVQSPGRSTQIDGNASSLLAIVDQHAADERCKVESLLKELCAIKRASEDDLTSNLGHQTSVASIALQKPICFGASYRELPLFRRHAQFFAQWGILYDLDLPSGSATDNKPDNRLSVLSLPPSILERCTANHKLLTELLRAEVWKRGDKGFSPKSLALEKPETNERHPWLRRLGDCPTGILEMLNSRACRSAIMFNDVISREESVELVRRLAECAFPLLCAHGRPSIVPLVHLVGTQEGQSGDIGRDGADWSGMESAR